MALAGDWSVEPTFLDRAGNPTGAAIGYECNRDVSPTIVREGYNSLNLGSVTGVTQ
jgi:hypothetical protein